MGSSRLDRIQDLFLKAADLPHAEQRRFVQAACEGDAAIEAAVLAMLEEDAGLESLLDRGVADAARSVLEDAAAAWRTQTFGPYRLVRLIGEGGMGVVFLAERDDLKSTAAIKILRDAWVSPARRQRFAREQQTQAQLIHASIAQIYDANVLADGTPWFAMEYVEGAPITEYCAARKSAIAERLGLLRDVCEAVQHAHRHLVIHRDLKPSNILVTADGVVKLLDFGISKHLHAGDASANQTGTGLRLMTPAYAAPEQVRGDRIGIYTDIYCLGVILYELLTGQLPFDLSNRTPGETTTILVEQEPARPSSIAVRPAGAPVAGKRAWADLDVLCQTAMHKEPMRRYQTVEALIRDIDHFTRGEPLEARVDSLSYRAGKFVTRHWRPLAAAAAMLVLLVGVVGFYTFRLAIARNDALMEAARTHRIQRFMLNLFEGGDRSVGPADDLRVSTLIDRGVQQARSLDNEPVVQAELYQTLGSVYQQLGNFERADSLLKTALDRRRAVLGADDPEVGESMVALGLLRDAQAQYDEAERLIRDALERSRRPGAGPHSVARATAALGRVLENRGAYDQAIPVLKEAVVLNGAPDADPADLASSLSELANTYYYAGQYQESEVLNRRLLPMHRQLYGDRHPLVADTLINLGAIQLEAGHNPEAERFDREALAITSAWYGQNHPETASALTILARSVIQQGRFDEASAMLREALAVQERVYGQVHPRVASALNELGLVALRQNRLDEAEGAFRRMADIYRAVYKDDHYLIGVALSNLAGVYQERHDYTAAERLFRDVLKRYGTTLAPDHQLVGIAKIRLGRQLVRQLRYAEAEGEILAGYRILMKQSAPPKRWLDTAREDLVTLYVATDQPQKARVYRDNPAAVPAANVR